MAAVSSELLKRLEERANMPEDDSPWGGDEPPGPETIERPQVRMGPDTHRIVEELDLHLGTHDPLTYQRNNELVIVAGSVARPRNRSILADGTPIVRAMTGPALHTRITRHVDMVAVEPPKEKASRLASVSADDPPRPTVKHVHPPTYVLAAMLEAQDWHHVRYLRGVTETPIMRADGSICQAAGYDEPTGYLYIPACEFPEVADAPTQADSRDALAELVDLFCDFPYVDEASRYVPISAILSILGRAAIDGAVPMHLFDASVMGSGKTIQCDIAHAIAVGRVPAHATWPVRDEDQEKILGGYAVAAPQAIVLDNVKGTFGGAAIEQTLTSTTVQFRILGKTEIRSLAWHSVVMVSGNNLELTDDMVRRTIMSRLESPLEDPTRRTGFKRPELLEHVRANRPRLATLALTVLRAYAAKGFTEHPCRMASYGAWARVVASAIVYAGGPDVTLAQPPRERARLDDSGGAAQLVALWPWSEPLSAKAMIGSQYPVPRANDQPWGLEVVREAIEALTPIKGAAPEAKSLGRKLMKFRGRWFANRRLVSREDPHTKIQLWSVESR